MPAARHGQGITPRPLPQNPFNRPVPVSWAMVGRACGTLQAKASPSIPGPRAGAVVREGPGVGMDEYDARLRALRERMGAKALYVSALPNIRYLTGFTGSSGHLLVEPEAATLFTDGRYCAQARAQIHRVVVEVSAGDSRPALAAGVRSRGLKRLGFEANRLGYETYSYLQGELPRCRLVPLKAQVESLRLIKSAAEVEAIRRSVELNSEAFDEVCSLVEPGWTESRFAAELEFRFRSLGAEGASFPTIVASGEHGALPHAQPRAEAIQPRSLVVVDQGAILDGYCSDMTRMIAIGHPDETQQKLVRAVLEAQEAAIDAIRPGVECRTVDARARQVLRKTTVGGIRLDTMFTHSTGHGLGLEIHEGPRIAPRQRQRLRAGMVITVEPGVYLEGRAGVRVEDVVAVTDGGCEVLTRTSRELRVVGESGAGRYG